MGPEYLYFIKKNDTEFYQINSFGELVSTTTPVPLEFPPEAWKETGIQNDRNDQYFGVDTTITIPYGFVEQGALIIKDIFYKLGPEEKVYLVIMQKALKYMPGPVATIGDGNLSIGSNLLAINGQPHSTVLVKLKVSGTQGSDYIFNDQFSLIPFGAYSVNQSSVIYSLTIPFSGQINIPLDFVNGSGTGSAEVQIVNEFGYSGVAYGFHYKLLMKGEIDVSKFIHSGYKVTVTIVEGGLTKFLKANQSTEYELSLDVPEAIIVKQDGIVLHNIVDNFLGEGIDPDPNYDIGNHLLDIQIVKEDSPFVLGKKSVSRTRVTNSNTAIRATGGWFEKVSTAGLTEFDYDFHVDLAFFGPPAQNPAAVFKIVVRRIDENNISDLQVELLSTTNFNSNYHVQGSSSIPVRPGDELYLYGFCNIVGSTGDAQLAVNYDISGSSFFNYKYKFVYPTTYIKTLPGWYVVNKLLEKISDGELTSFKSNLLTLVHDNIVFTSGDGLRSLEKSVLKLSLKKIFQFYNSINDVGLSYKKGTVSLETRKDLVNYASLVNIGEFSFPEVSSIESMRFNTSKFGYPDKNQEGINGKEEFNCNYSYSLPAPRSVKELDKTTQIIAGCYQSETTRVNFEKRATTDSGQDNDIFCYQVERQIQAAIPESFDLPFRKLDRNINQYITSGLIEPATVFNVELAVPFNVKRNGALIRSCMWDLDSKLLKYETSERNSNVVITLPSGEVVKFNQSYQLANLDQRYLKSILIKFKTEGVYNLLQQLDSDSLKCFIGTFKGESYIFVPKTVSIQPATFESQEYEMICGFETSLIPLIKYNGE